MLTISNDIELLARLLRPADEDEARIVGALRDPRHTAYLIKHQAESVGALLIDWQTEHSEIVYIALAESARGRGLGKAVIAHVITEARRRGVRALLVGTANSSLDNLAFYQKCGFRFDSIRRDYFSDLDPPVFEHGIRMVDLVMLRHTL